MTRLLLAVSDPERAEKIREAFALASRASVAVVAPTLRANGVTLTASARDEMLAKCAAGEYCELEVDLLAYEQKPGEQNRNFVRFRDGAMMALGSTGKGRPFLRDHEQGNVLARAGTILASKTDKRADGDYAIQQTAKLTAPWAIDLALRGLIDTVSIGWKPTGPVLCSACNREVFTACWHFPGDRLSEKATEDGGTRKVRDPNGDIVVEWIYTAAELVETSVVSVPGVPSAHIEGVRASLSAALEGGPPPFNQEKDVMLTKLITILGLAATAGESEVTRAVESLKADRDLCAEQRDRLAKENAGLAARVELQEETARKQREDAFIADALASGKIAPGSKAETSLRKWFAVDEEAAREHVQAAPAVTLVGAKRQSEGGDIVVPPPPAAKAKALLESHGIDHAQSVSYARMFGAKDPEKAIAKHVAGEEV